MRLSVASADADAGVVASREVLVICGPTASGKSEHAMRLAERMGASTVTIVSADSRQVYRGFDVGTAKPTSEEQSRIAHRCIDIADPTERYSAARWANEASAAIDDAIASGRTPIVVGGTGLYLRALFEGLFDEPPLDEDRRRALQLRLDTMDTETLRHWVASLDPARSHLGRMQLIRAIEIALLTGRRVSELHGERATPPRWRAKYLLVDPGPSLGQRIAERIDRMLDHGWPDEVQRLMQTVPEDAPAWNATGYEAVRRLVRGESSRAKVHEEILIGTRQYAKRQRTWFRNQLPQDAVTHLSPQTETA